MGYIPQGCFLKLVARYHMEVQREDQTSKIVHMCVYLVIFRALLGFFPPLLCFILDVVVRQLLRIVMITQTSSFSQCPLDRNLACQRHICSGKYNAERDFSSCGYCKDCCLKSVKLIPVEAAAWLATTHFGLSFEGFKFELLTKLPLFRQ